MKRIFSKKEKAENEVKVKKRFLNKKIYIAIMLILILLLISILMFARSNGIKNFGDIKNFINNKLNSEEPQQANETTTKKWSEVGTGGDLIIDPKYSYGTIFYMDGSKISVEGTLGPKVQKKINNDNNTAAFAALKGGRIKFRISKCAIDEKGNVCDVIVEVSDITPFEDTLPQYVVERPNTFLPAVGAFGQDYIDGGDQNRGSDRFRNVVKVSLDSDTNLYRIGFSTLFAESDFTINYVKTGTDTKAEINNIFCVIDNFNIMPDDAESNHKGDGVFNGNETVLVPKSLSDQIKIVYAENKNLVEVKKNYSYKGKDYTAVHRSNDTSMGIKPSPSNNKEEWWMSAGIMLEDLNTKGKFKIHYSGVVCGIGMEFNAPYVPKLQEPLEKKIWPGSDGRPKGMGSDKIITPVEENEVKEGEIFRYAITQYLPNARAVRKVNDDFSKVNKPYKKFEISDVLEEDLEIEGGKNNIKIRNESGEDVSEYFKEPKYDESTKEITIEALSESLSDPDFYCHYYTVIIPVKVRAGLLDEKGEDKDRKKSI